MNNNPSNSANTRHYKFGRPMNSYDFVRKTVAYHLKEHFNSSPVLTVEEEEQFVAAGYYKNLGAYTIAETLSKYRVAKSRGTLGGLLEASCILQGAKA